MSEKIIKAALKVKSDSSRSRSSSASFNNWERHEYGYGFVCRSCGYHGRSQVGRDIHDRRGCIQPPKGGD